MGFGASAKRLPSSGSGGNGRPSSLFYNAWCYLPWRITRCLASRLSNRRFVFSLAATSTLSAKAVHVYTHLSALPTVYLWRWGYSFLLQDIAIILILRLLLEIYFFSISFLFQRLAFTVASALIFFTTILSVVNITFFSLAGSEIHWRNIQFANDASSRALMLTGVVSLFAVIGSLILLSLVFQDVLFVGSGLVVDLVKRPFQRFLFCDSRYSGKEEYRAISQSKPFHDVEEDEWEEGSNTSHRSQSPSREPIRSGTLIAYLILAFICLPPAALTALRPHESSLIFLSWTTILLPFLDISSFIPNLNKLEAVYGSGINHDWDNRTAVVETTALPWLSEAPKIQGFEDWYNARSHYNASFDPLKISNLDSKLLPGLKNKLKDIDIRHVVILLLESTRKDVFPMKKDGMIWNKLSNSFADGKLPESARQRLETLTPNANFITGDYDDDFPHEIKRQRGGINFNNAYTTGTFTLKSVAGTLCGITPLAADFNEEWTHHVYQPCLAQILSALNEIEDETGSQSDNNQLASSKWYSNFMQSVTLKFSNFDLLMAMLGYGPDDLISKESLQSPSAKFGPVRLPDVNYFGLAEPPLEDYIKDSFESAKKNNGRVFLTHITSTSHHPFGLPADEKYIPVSNGLDELSKYMNAIAYDDKWIGRVLDILEEQDVANNTLVVVVGDHGISVPENNIAATYYNTNAGTLRVPLVISHPQLPAINVDTPVISSQILPTILDVLLETDSLNKGQRKAVNTLIQNYEGQSLLRPQKLASEAGVGNWHFTIVTPGRAMLSVRDARRPDLHLIVPVVENTEWRLTNLTTDPIESSPLLGFDFGPFLGSVEDRHGREVAEWVEEAAFITRWWLEDHYKRWRFGPHAG